MASGVSSTFGSLAQAGTGLTAASYGLQIVSQNIDNANTPGYTRQTSSQAAVDGAGGVPSLYTAQVGLGGVRIASTLRMNDPVLDARARTEYARSGAADESSTNLSSIEAIFPEPADNGLSEQLSDFWNSWTGVANDPGSVGNTAPRSVLLGSSAQVASTLNSLAHSLDDVSTGIAQSLNDTVKTANASIDQLTDLNKQIAVGVATGQSVNSLLDQRDVLLDQLSTSFGATYSAALKPDGTPTTDGTVDVWVGGQKIVQWSQTTGSSADYLAVDNGTPADPTAVPPTPAVPATYAITTGADTRVPPHVPPIDSGGAVAPTGGTAAADYTALTTTIPGYLTALDGVAQQLADSVNTQQAAGFDLSGNAGIPMFSYTPTTTPGFRPGDLAASLQVATGFSEANVAASSSGNAATTGADKDGSNALAASKLGNAVGSADKLYQSLVGAIGQASKNAASASVTQASVTQSVDSLRTASSGVSTDEEMSNLLTYQRAYQASGRVISIIDDMLDTIINGMGVG